MSKKQFQLYLYAESRIEMRLSSTTEQLRARTLPRRASRGDLNYYSSTTTCGGEIDGFFALAPVPAARDLQSSRALFLIYTGNFSMIFRTARQFFPCSLSFFCSPHFSRTSLQKSDYTGVTRAHVRRLIDSLLLFD